METPTAAKRPFINKRILCAALIPAVLFALICIFCSHLRQNHSLAGMAWSDGLRFVLLMLLFGAILTVLFALMNRQVQRSPKAEKWLSRFVSNGFVVFLFLLACWVPVWLAFWPGHFSADPITQFYSYYNEEHSTHHPLLHTLLLGFCMMLGIDASPEGYATNGLALYCGIQMVIVAACMAYAISWSKRHGVPVWARLIVTLLFGLSPFYAPWTFCAQKDVIFGALVLVLTLQLTDIWTEGLNTLRIIGFLVTALLMMLFRNNGLYAFLLLLPFAVWWKRSSRIATAVLLVACIILYLVVNNALIYALDAEKGSKVEMLSVPLQQIGRTLKQNPDAIDADTEGVLETLYGDTSIADTYDETISDPLKWAIDYDSLDENIPSLLSLWLRMALDHLPTYTEAFLIQNLPYLLPGSDMRTYFDFEVQQPEWFPIEQTSYLPQVQQLFETYDDTLVYAGIPGSRYFSDAALHVWFCIIGFAFAVFRRDYGKMTAFAFLLSLWITCLLGPVANIRYMLGIYIAVPVLFASLLMPGKKGGMTSLESE